MNRGCFMLIFFANLSNALWNSLGLRLRSFWSSIFVLWRATVLLYGNVGLSSVNGKGSSIMPSLLWCAWLATFLRNAVSSCEYPFNSSSLSPFNFIASLAALVLSSSIYFVANLLVISGVGLFWDVDKHTGACSLFLLLEGWVGSPISIHPRGFWKQSVFYHC